MKQHLWLALTDAQRELLRELAAGRTMKQAAHALRVSTRALHFRWQACRMRLGCETPAHAIALLAGDSLSLVDEMSNTQAERRERDDGNRSRPRRLGAFALALARSS
jgi:DNA-binding CsgD family transcriptional regulator